WSATKRSRLSTASLPHPPQPGSSVSSALAAVRLFGFLILDVPLDAKLIGDHAKAGGPESLLKGHAYGSVLRQGSKHAFGLTGVIYAQHKAEAPRGLIGSRD